MSVPAARSTPAMCRGVHVRRGRFYPNHIMYWMSGQVEAFIDAVGVKMRGNTMRCQAQYLRIPRLKGLEPSEVEGFVAVLEAWNRDFATECMERVAYRMRTGRPGMHDLIVQRPERPFRESHGTFFVPVHDFDVRHDHSGSQQYHAFLWQRHLLV